jgi:hypothetical protein
MQGAFSNGLHAGYDWLALEAATLSPASTPILRKAKKPRPCGSKPAFSPMVDLVKPKEPWEISLTALVGLNPKAETSSKSAAQKPSIGWPGSSPFIPKKLDAAAQGAENQRSKGAGAGAEPLPCGG